MPTTISVNELTQVRLHNREESCGTPLHPDLMTEALVEGGSGESRGVPVLLP